MVVGSKLPCLMWLTAAFKQDGDIQICMVFILWETLEKNKAYLKEVHLVSNEVGNPGGVRRHVLFALKLQHRSVVFCYLFLQLLGHFVQSTDRCWEGRRKVFFPGHFPWFIRDEDNICPPNPDSSITHSATFYNCFIFLGGGPVSPAKWRLSVAALAMSSLMASSDHLQKKETVCAHIGTVGFGRTNGNCTKKKNKKIRQL